MDKGNQISEQIQTLLSSKSIPFKYLEHEPTPTSIDSARVRGTPLHEGAKALILRTSKEHKNYMVVLPGDKKIDSKKLREILGDSFSFEKPEVILEKYGLVIGGVPPFGFLFDIPTYYDTSILGNVNVSFNCGTKTQSIDMKVPDFKEAVVGDWVEISQ
jgi:nondiscriminating aspartyl-tRNA synthetase